MILHNIKTWWISMLSPLKHILVKYQPFFIEMVFNSPIIPIGGFHPWPFMWCGDYVIYNVLCSNVGNCEALMKFVWLCNFVTTMKICQDDIHKLYVNLISTFNNLFCSFHGLTSSWGDVHEMVHHPKLGNWSPSIWVQ